MLTNMFYYGYYKPYLIKETNSSKSVKRTKSKKEIAKAELAKSGKSSYSYQLNKKIKDDIISYATEISSNLNSIKDVSKFIVNRYSKRNIVSDEEKKNFADGLDDFVNEVNSFNEFYEANENESSALTGYDNILGDRLSQFEGSLNTLGVSISEKGDLSFDRAVFENIKDENYIDNIFDCAEMFNDIYKDTCEVMQLPLAEHMNFKNLDYYYNYAYSPRNKESFKFIETGLLVDIRL